MGKPGRGRPRIRIVDHGDWIEVQMLVLRRRTTLRNGKVVDAREYGYQAFPIWVRVAVIRKAA